jgi:F0F1-type ATP synthase delta subunit
MDKKQFCEEMTVKLKDLDRLFQLTRAVAPATAQKSFQQDQRRPRLHEARTRVEALRLRLDAVCASAAPLTDPERTEIEQKLAEVMELLR